MLREIEHGIRVLAWQRTKDGAKETGHKHFPKPIPLTPAERAEQITETAMRGDGTPVAAPSLDDTKQYLSQIDPRWSPRPERKVS